MAKTPSHDRELGRLGRQLATAQSRVDAVRDQLDERLAYWHGQDVPIAELARATGVSRETVYKAIKRHRAQQLGS